MSVHLFIHLLEPVAENTAKDKENHMLCLHVNIV